MSDGSGLTGLNAGSRTRRDPHYWRLDVDGDSSAVVNAQARPGETEAERDDRNLIELLQELRVAGLGVQVLFGFLLALPFTNRFVKLSAPQHALYLASLLLAATATARCWARSLTTGWCSAATKRSAWSRTRTSWQSAALRPLP
jgi:Family of unknown function (DUF6328)